MRGYTDGVQKDISENSLNGGLNWTLIKDNVTSKTDILTTLNNYFGEGTYTEDDVTELMNDGYLEDAEEGEVTYFDGKLGYEESWYDVFDKLSEGGLLYTKDGETWTRNPEDAEGMRLGAAGEHLGSVSVWIDTYHNTVEGWGEVLPISVEDAQELNEVGLAQY